MQLYPSTANKIQLQQTFITKNLRAILKYVKLKIELEKRTSPEPIETTLKRPLRPLRKSNIDITNQVYKAQSK